MRTYTIEEAIEEMANSVQVFSAGYGTWDVKANLGIRSTGEYVEDKFTTHDEGWKTGEFDGETYNPQDYSEWLDDYFKSEFEDVLSDDALALITDAMKELMFENWCEKLWSDSANEDNYAPASIRDTAAAKQIIESWIDDNEWPDNVVVSADGTTIFVLDESESEWVDEHNDALAMLVDGRAKEFIDAYNNREEEA